MSTDPAGRESQDLVVAAKAIWEAALARVQPAVVMARAIEASSPDEILVAGERVPLAPGARVRLLALGKAGDALARAALVQLGARLDARLVVTKSGHAPSRP